MPTQKWDTFWKVSHQNHICISHRHNSKAIKCRPILSNWPIIEPKQAWQLICCLLDTWAPFCFLSSFFFILCFFFWFVLQLTESLELTNPRIPSILIMQSHRDLCSMSKSWIGHNIRMIMSKVITSFPGSLIFPPGSGKMRDPGNEVGKEKLFFAVNNDHI